MLIKYFCLASSLSLDPRFIIFFIPSLTFLLVDHFHKVFICQILFPYEIFDRLDNPGRLFGLNCDDLIWNKIGEDIQQNFI